MTLKKQRTQLFFMLFVMIIFLHVLSFIENTISGDELFMCLFGYSIVFLLFSMLELKDDDREVKTDESDLFI